MQAAGVIILENRNVTIYFFPETFHLKREKKLSSNRISLKITILNRTVVVERERERPIQASKCHIGFQ